MALESINPATGERIATYPETASVEVDAILERAEGASQSWRLIDISERAASMRAAADVLRRRVEPYARLMTEEMGKPIVQSRAEIEKCAWCCDYYADNAHGFLADIPVETDASCSFVAFQPLGVILAVMPWNFPFWQVFRFAAPGLMAGNAGVLKHASNVMGCALAIEEVFREAGFPSDLFRALIIPSSRVAGVIGDPRVQAVTLTGSTAAGKAVAERAGALIKKTVLELGGSDPYVILEDADLDRAVETCAVSRLLNGGQSCIAAKRFIVVDAVREAFEARFTERMAATVMGDPMREDVDLGPQARVDLRAELHDQVVRSAAQGARLVLGGYIPEGPGAYYPPTVLTDVRRGMPVHDEETFGPVAAIIPVADEAEAIRSANDSPFGLGAAVFTADVERGERIAAEALAAGNCFVNAFVKSDPRLPFGGVKESGYGRELSVFGIREFVNIKTVYVA